MDKKNHIIVVGPRSKEYRDELEAEIKLHREKFGKGKNWPEIEKLLREDVNDKDDDTTLASGFFKNKNAGQGKDDEEAYSHTNGFFHDCNLLLKLSVNRHIT